MRLKKIKELFSNRMIIIDEVHNLRISRDNSESNIKSAEVIMDMVRYADNLKLLLLSATPMYNSYEEIIWLTNLMNSNDNKALIKMSDIFNNKGEFIRSGRELLIRKLTGYVSYVRGENPYTFPVRIYANHKIIWILNSLNLLDKLITRKSRSHYSMYLYFIIASEVIKRMYIIS